MNESVTEESKRTYKHEKIRKAAFWIALIGANVLFYTTIWLLNSYDKICFDQFLYQMKSSATGVDSSIRVSAVLIIGVCGILSALAEGWIIRFLSGGWKLKKCVWYQKFRENRFCTMIRRHGLALSVLLLVTSVFYFSDELHVFAYVGKMIDSSDFIEENYVDPRDAELEFPEQKRNLIYIYLESMESTFSDPQAGPDITDNYIPELSRLAEDNVHFSHTDRLGGAMPFAGTTWTAASMVSQTSGVPVKINLAADNYGAHNSYMPGIVSLGDLLQEQGYNQTLLMGSNAEFANRDSYFTDHGNYQILDVEAMKAARRLPEDYWVWWGYEDEKLFSYAKEELMKLSAKGEPFNLTLLTADTHFPDGYPCDLCEDIYEEQYANVLACSSRQVVEFVEWIQEQPFYENTTIVISGDHQTMDPDFLSHVDDAYVRSVYNCIINPAVKPERQDFRQFGTFDMFPTTLAAMGVRIEGDRLGLGTNLFSDTQTLSEIYGWENLDQELQKTSHFYNETFFE